MSVSLQNIDWPWRTQRAYLYSVGFLCVFCARCSEKPEVTLKATPGGRAWNGYPLFTGRREYLPVGSASASLRLTPVNNAYPSPPGTCAGISVSLLVPPVCPLCVRKSDSVRGYKHLCGFFRTGRFWGCVKNTHPRIALRSIRATQHPRANESGGVYANISIVLSIGHRFFSLFQVLTVPFW